MEHTGCYCSLNLCRDPADSLIFCVWLVPTCEALVAEIWLCFARDVCEVMFQMRLFSAVRPTEPNVQHKTKVTKLTNIGVRECHIGPCLLDQSYAFERGLETARKTIDQKLIYALAFNKPTVSFIKQTREITEKRAAFLFAVHRPSSAGARMPMTSGTVQRLH